MGLLSFQTFEKYFEIPSRDMEVLRIYKGTWQGRLALVSICEIDVTSFSEDGRGVKWLCN
jgi:hypothetical protein